MQTAETAISIVDHGIRNGNHRTATLPERIVDSDTGEIIAVPGSLTSTGWDIPEGTEPEDVLPCLNQFFRWERSLNWAIGDGIRYIWHTAGDMYSDAIEATGIDLNYLTKIVWVSKNVPICNRLQTLSWSHHEAVAALDLELQKFWLNRAAPQDGESRAHFSVRELKAAIATEKHLASERARLSGTGTGIVHFTDAIDFLESCESGAADLLITDPPYSTDVNDIWEFADSWVSLALSRLKPTGRAYICTGAYPDELHAYLRAFERQLEFTCANVLVWTYRNTMGPSPTHDYKLNWQSIFYLRGADAPPLAAPTLNEQFSVIDITAPDGRHGTRVHEWQKPDELADRLIAHSTQPGDIVLDPFAGTGTFIAAAARAGCTAIGSDTDREMLELCAKRGIEVVE